jgi:uncharacterized protein YecE (DUF72 family)
VKIDKNGHKRKQTEKSKTGTWMLSQPVSSLAAPGSIRASIGSLRDPQLAVDEIELRERTRVRDGEMTTEARPDSRIRIGTAGWAYADWNGVLYPKPMLRGVDRLTYMTRYFDVIEINSTFYAPADEAKVQGWLAKTAHAPDFRFAIKLWQRFTHERDSAWTRADERDARIALEPVHAAGKLGAVLVQFPWSFKRTEENRMWLGDVVSAFREFPLVIEIRHESWNVPHFYESLAELGVGFVNIDQPLFKKSIKPSATVTSPIGYVRVHGRNYAEWFRESANVRERYDYLYSPDELAPWVSRVEQIAARADDVYVLTNNHNLGKAGVNALQLESMITHRKVVAPPQLFASYPEVLAPFAEPG